MGTAPQPKIAHGIARLPFRLGPDAPDRSEIFEVLWERHGTADDGDRTLAWGWFNAWQTVSDAIAALGPGSDAIHVADEILIQGMKDVAGE
jgi:hypothetical protein